jgi:hypothetical protein
MSRIWLIFVGLLACKGHDKPAPAAGSASVSKAPISAPEAPHLGSDRPALPEAAADAGPPSIDDTFADEAVEPADKTRLEGELGKRLTKVPSVKSFECRTTQCRIVLGGNQAEVEKAIDALEADHQLHEFARNIILTAPTTGSDGKVELHVFAQLR